MIKVAPEGTNFGTLCTVIPYFIDIIMNQGF